MHLRIYSHFYTFPLIRHSWLFVDFFFVLSGFVISYVYLENLNDVKSVLRFAIRRWGRLWPLHATVLLAMIGLEGLRYFLSQHGVAATRLPFSGQYAASSIPENFLLLHALRPTQVATWNGASWSISTEYYTYILFAALCLTNRRLVVGGALLLAVIGAIGVYLYVPTYMQTEGQIVIKSAAIPTSNFTWLRCIYGFFVGVLTHQIWRCRTKEPSGWLEVAIVLLAIGFVSIVGETIWSMLAPLMFAAVVGFLACERGPITRLLKTKPLIKVGLLSYSIYMVHTLVFSLLASEQSARIAARLTGHNSWTTMTVDGRPAALLSFGSPWLGDIVALCIMTALLGVSAITYNFIEQPGRHFFNRLASQISR